jgi:hypothetical protein
MHEKPRGFAGFKASPAAFLIDGIQNNRTPPDWFHAHEKRQERRQWEQQHATQLADEQSLRLLYKQERTAALQTYLDSPEGRQKYEEAYQPYLALCRIKELHRPHDAASEAAKARVERFDFEFPEFALWALGHREQAGQTAA